MAEEKATQIGYKIVDRNLRARDDFQYTVGQTATTNGTWGVLADGLHYCPKLAAHCYQFVTGFQPPLRYLLVSPKSEVRENGDVSATLNLYVNQELTYDEWMKIIYAQSSIDIHATLLAAGCEGHIALFREHANHPDAVIAEVLEGAARFGHLGLVRYIMDNFKSRIKEERLNEALAAAVSFGSESVATFLIKSGVTDLNTPLSVAAVAGNVQMLKLLIDAGAEDLQSTLSEAVENNRIYAVRYLIRARAVPTYEDMEIAVDNKCIEVLRNLLLSEEKFDTKPPNRKFDPLILNNILGRAARIDFVAALEILSITGADDFDKALRAAGVTRAIAAMKFALSHGANDTSAIFQKAIADGDAEIVYLLSRYGALEKFKRQVATAEAMIAKYSSDGALSE